MGFFLIHDRFNSQAAQTASVERCQNWQKKHLDVRFIKKDRKPPKSAGTEEKLGITFPKNTYPYVTLSRDKTKRWAVITTTYQYYLESQRRVITQIFKGVICVDRQSRYVGNIYAQDKIELYIKFAGLCVARPVHTIAKTIFHLSMVKVAYDAFRWLLLIGPDVDLAQTVKEELLDIFRTPFYGALLSTNAIGAVLIAPFHSDSLYEARASTDILLKKLWRNQRPPFWIDMSPCMRRALNILDLDKDPRNVPAGGEKFIIYPFLKDIITDKGLKAELKKKVIYPEIDVSAREYTFQTKNAKYVYGYSKQAHTYVALSHLARKYGSLVS